MSRYAIIRIGVPPSMSNFVPLDEAAKKLGVSVDSLVDMRSRGDIFGYRDGGSWKFKPEEIERVASEMMGVLDDDPAGSSILVSDSDLESSSKHGSTIGSDVLSSDEGSDVDSDVELVPDPGTDSDVRLVASKSAVPEAGGELEIADSDDDDDELALSADDGEDILAAASGAASSLGSDLELAGSDIGSDVPLTGSDALDLAPSPDASDVSNVISGSDLSLDGSAAGDLIKGDSDPGIDSGSLDLQGSDLELTDDGDLVLGGGSDLALGTDSGINLMSPADSGISLEDEPLDLAASGISGLDLAAEGSGSDVGGSASGSAVDFQQDEEFQLSPSGAIEADDDSGSQVIELEDSSEFGDAAVALPAEDGFDAFSDAEGGGGLEEASDTLGAAPAAAMMGVPEVPYSLLQVLSLMGILLLMCMSGILVTDVVRNMWAFADGGNAITSGFTDMIISAFQQ